MSKEARELAMEESEIISIKISVRGEFTLGICFWRIDGKNVQI
jgi:hypothetical protein